MDPINGHDIDKWTVKTGGPIGFGLSTEYTSSAYFGNFNGEPMVVFKSSGEIIVAKGVKMDDAAKVVMAALGGLWGSLLNKLKTAEIERDNWRAIAMGYIERERLAKGEAAGIQEL